LDLYIAAKHYSDLLLTQSLTGKAIDSNQNEPTNGQHIYKDYLVKLDKNHLLDHINS